MRTGVKTGGVTVVELLIVVAIIAVLASLIFPVLARPRHGGARQTTCLSQQRQIATAALMYVQDSSGKFPGVDWSDQLQKYLSSTKMYVCPSSNDEDGQLSYGYNGALVKIDGTGVSEAHISVPTEVGMTCDVTPARLTHYGGLITGGGWRDAANSGAVGNAVTPDPRHSRGLIMSFTDGHAKYLPDGYNEKNIANTVTRAFFLAPTYGMIDNPGGGIPGAAVNYPPGMKQTDLIIGGDSATSSIITAVAEVYRHTTKKAWRTHGFYGLNFTKGRPADSDSRKKWLWGDASRSERTPTVTITQNGKQYTGRAVAYDALVFIVAKNSKLTTIASGVNLGFDFQAQYSTKWGTFVVNTAQIAALYAPGTSMTANTYTAYTLRRTPVADGSSVLRQGGLIYFLHKVLGVPGDANGCATAIGAQAVDVENELDMVDKVANDPYAIGYCSSSVADPDRITILALDTSRTIGAKELDDPDYVYPRKNLKYRWYAPATVRDAESRWPYYRHLYVFGSDAKQVDYLFGPRNPIMTQVKEGPLFRDVYWAP